MPAIDRSLSDCRYDDVGPELLELVSRLPAVLAGNREPCKGLLLLEGYVLLGGERFMQVRV